MQGSCTVRPTHLKHSPTSSVNLPVRPASTVAGRGKITLAFGKLQEMAYSVASTPFSVSFGASSTTCVLMIGDWKPEDSSASENK